MGWGCFDNEKRCLSCAFWQGPRKVDYNGKWSTDGPSVYGKCAQGVFSGVTSGHSASSGLNCSKYVKLPAKR